MWIAAWSSKHGPVDNLFDEWSVHDTEQEANDAISKAVTKYEDDLYCWAVGPIKTGSEPHYDHPGLTL